MSSIVLYELFLGHRKRKYIYIYILRCTNCILTSIFLVHLMCTYVVMKTIFIFLLNNISPQGISVSSIILYKLFLGHRKRGNIYIYSVVKIVFLKL